MPSQALQKWLTERTATLDDMERAHRSLRGTGPGARAATQLVNQAYVVLLAAQFQGFCRFLHTECVEVFVSRLSPPDYQFAVRVSLLLGRKLDRGNPNPGNIGSDFGRFNLDFWSLVDAQWAGNPQRKAALEELNGWRNAIAHHDFPATMLVAGRPNLVLAQVQTWRKACDRLARSFDEVMRHHLLGLFGVSPW